MLKPGILATQTVSTMPLEWFSCDDRDGSICSGWKSLLLFGADEQRVNQSKQHSSSSYAALTFAVLTWAWAAPLTSDGFFCWWRTHVLLVPVLFEDLDHGLTWPAATQRDTREPGHREQIHLKCLPSEHWSVWASSTFKLGVDLLRELEFIESFPQGSYVVRICILNWVGKKNKHCGNLRCSCFHCTSDFQRISKSLAGDVWRVWHCDPQQLLCCFSYSETFWLIFNIIRSLQRPTRHADSEEPGPSPPAAFTSFSSLAPFYRWSKHTSY